MLEVNTRPCANHGEVYAVRHHCNGALDGACHVRLGERVCHIAVYCRRCDYQWVEPCHARQVTPA